MAKFKDLTGETFGRLTVVRRIGTDKNKKTLWLCKCSCGNEKEAITPSLIRGATKSCGCLQAEHNQKGNTKHGFRYNRIYKIWLGILQRTGNKNNPDYDKYGGRGITICDEWKNDFMSFYNWSIENGHQDGLSIDRKDNNKGYSPDNCRWVTQKVQCNNTSRTRKLTLNGETKSLTQWAEETGISSTLITARIDKLGWSIEKALTEPVHKQNRRNKNE